MKRLGFVLMLLIAVLQLSAQNELVILTYDGPVKHNSKYNRIAYMDSRLNPANFGYLSDGDVVVNTPIAIQLEAVLAKMISESVGEETLLVQLRKMNFFTAKRVKEDIGVCVLRMNLYQKDGNDYYFISKLDTIIESTVKTVSDEGALAMTSFIADNLEREHDSLVPFSLDVIQRIDDFEKDAIPLYVNRTFKDGLYLDYDMFMSQEPDTSKLRVTIKKSELKDVRVIDKSGKWHKLKPENLYAVVINGTAYIAYDDKYSLVYFDGNDLKFQTTRTTTVVPPGISVGVGVGRGFSGGIGFSFGTKKKEKVIMKIDHLNGIAEDVR